MSYASVAAQNVPKSSQQPKPDPNLLEGQTDSNDVNTQPLDVNSKKVNVVPSQTDLDHVKTESHEFYEKAQEREKELAKEAEKAKEKAKKNAKQEAKKLKKAAHEAGQEIESFWQRFSNDPKQWSPVVGAINVALLGGVGIFAYAKRDEIKRWDRRLISAITVGVLGLIGGQSYLAAETARKQSGKN